MNEQELESARRVIEYLWDDEEKHYEKVGPLNGHIFVYLTYLKMYLGWDLNHSENVAKLLKPLRRIIDYLWNDEQKSFETSGAPADHIFPHIETLNIYLNKETIARGITIYELPDEPVPIRDLIESLTCGHEDEDE